MTSSGTEMYPGTASGGHSSVAVVVPALACCGVSHCFGLFSLMRSARTGPTRYADCTFLHKGLTTHSRSHPTPVEFKIPENRHQIVIQAANGCVSGAEVYRGFRRKVESLVVEVTVFSTGVS